MTRSRSLSTLLVAMVLALSSSIGAVGQTDESSWLAVVHGQVTDTTADTLTLDAGSRGVAFTDRPERTVRLFDVRTWVELAWAEDGAFAVEPPNASLVDETENAIAIVEITGSAWVDGLLTLEVTYLEGEAPTVGDVVALTVDDGGTNSGMWGG